MYDLELFGVLWGWPWMVILGAAGSLAAWRTWQRLSRAARGDGRGPRP